MYSKYNADEKKEMNKYWGDCWFNNFKWKLKNIGGFIL